jgi:glycosyltransferase involved in cell wall biosynthesis
MQELQNENPRLLILGTGPQDHVLKEEVKAYQLSNKVLFPGYVDETKKFQLLKMANLYLSTSQHEGFGLTFLEAMACGLPIICYDYSGQSDFLQDGRTGYLVPLNNRTRFTECCQALMHNPHLCQTMGEYNLQKVEELFIERCAQRYEDMFNEAIASYQRTEGLSV